MELKDRMIFVTDVETTGLDPRACDILEIGSIKVDHDLNELGRFSEKIAMQHPETATPEALIINGYTAEDWRFAEPLIRVMERFAGFTKDGILAAWNITFEYGFLDESFRRVGIKNLMGYHRIDVPSIAWFSLPDIKKFSLDGVAEALGLPPEPKPHRAITGAQYALDVLRKLKEKNAR